MDDWTPEKVVARGREELMRRALSADRAGDNAQAERWYREWMRLLPGDPYPRYGLSLILLKAGRYAEGWELYEARTDVPEAGISRPEAPTRTLQSGK